MNEDIAQKISEAIQSGRPKMTRNLVRQALEEGTKVDDVLTEGLLKGLDELGKQFKDGKAYVSELLVGVQAMNAGMSVIEQLMDKQLKSTYVGECKGTVVIGTVKGDMHDIGKNIVSMVLEKKGFHVYDLGVDVEPAQFVEKAEEVHADIVCISAMLTTTMPLMKEVIDRFVRKKLRDKYMIMVGGAPVTQSYAQQIGADYYSDDAPEAAAIAEAYMEKKTKQEK